MMTEAISFFLFVVKSDIYRVVKLKASDFNFRVPESTVNCTDGIRIKIDLEIWHLTELVCISS